MSKKIIPSAHLLECFMPYINNERRMLDVIRRSADIGYYKNFELGVFFDRYNRIYVRNILEEYGLTAFTFATPYTKMQKLSLSSLDSSERAAAVELVKQLADCAADTGFIGIGIPSGDDPGIAGRAEAKRVLADVMCTLAEYCASLGLRLTIEPLDRYAYKKQLIGPVIETVNWFAPIHAAHPNAYIHWDSAHEALSGADLMQSLEYAAPYTAQIHLCNAILDRLHPCYGDLHMECGTAPDFENEGFLTPKLGAEIIRRFAAADKPEGVERFTVSIEVLGHPGDDLWLKEKNTRAFLQKCFELAEAEK